MNPSEGAPDGYPALMRGPTGYDERLVPELSDPGNLAQHLARYRFAIPYCTEKVVLDAGVGVGYGAAMIAQVAARTCALDYDHNCITYAARTYGSAQMYFLVADVHELPVATALADVVISFEVIEHIANHERFLTEIRRVLKPTGVLLISTPNKKTATLFRAKAGFSYDAHISEVGLDAFAAELGRHFSDVTVLGMRLRGSALYGLLRALDVWNLRLRVFGRQQIDFAREKLFGVASRAASEDDVVISQRQLRQANHFLAICSGKRG